MTENIKIVFIGDDSVGKTCFLISYCNNSFPDDYVPTVFDNYGATVLYENKHVAPMFFDTACSEDYDRLRPLSYPETNVFAICFSLMDRLSFENVKSKWYPEIQEHAPGTLVVLLGLQLDLRENEELVEELKKTGEKPPVTRNEGEKLARELRCKGYYECSAKTQKGLKEAMQGMFRSYFDPEICRCGSCPECRNGRPRRNFRNSCSIL